MIRKRYAGMAMPLVLLIFIAPAALAQQVTDSSFSYQGQLTTVDGPVNQSCDFSFGLFGAATGGAEIGSSNVPGVDVSGGLFTVSLDFGATAFDGGARWLEVAVDCGGGVSTLPRQQLTASPYSLTSLSTIGLQGRPISPAAPEPGEVLAWDGDQWAPAPDADSGGDITSVNAGEGLIGGATEGDATLAVDTATIQRRVGGCPGGQNMRAVNADGSVACQSDARGVVTVNAETGLSGGGTGTTVGLSVDSNVVQQRVGTCPAGQAMIAVEQDGTPQCAQVGLTGWEIVSRDCTMSGAGGGTSTCFPRAFCTRSKRVIGGGVWVSSLAARVSRSSPISDQFGDGWEGAALKRSDDASPDGGPITVTTSVICAFATE